MYPGSINVHFRIGNNYKMINYVSGLSPMGPAQLYYIYNVYVYSRIPLIEGHICIGYLFIYYI